MGFGRFQNSLTTYIPIGFQGNFHFYQLIDDKTSNDIHGDKLDIYAGLAIGGGPVFWSGGQGFGSSVNAALHVGPHVGARYYLTDKLGIFAELGYGRSLAMFGIVLR